MSSHASATGPEASPTEHLTPAEAAEWLNRFGFSWNDGELGTGVRLSYAFRATAPEDAVGFSRFTPLQIQTALNALAAWADVADVTFVRVGFGTSGAQAYSDKATVLFSNYNDPKNMNYGQSGVPLHGDRSSASYEGDVTANVAAPSQATPVLWDRGPHTMTHELGHALGFSHISDFAASGTGSYDEIAPFVEDTKMYSMMSNWSETNTGGDFHGHFSASPMLFDIAAAQYLYGPNLGFQTGDTVYGFNATAVRPWYVATPEAPPIFCAWDCGGNDTFDFSGYGVAQTINLNNEAFSSVGGYRFNVSIAKAVKVDGVFIDVIENAIGGSGADKLVGNGAANRLEGRDGADVVGGGKGADTIIGGLGKDALKGAGDADVFVYASLADSLPGTEDRISGLARADWIDLSAIDADGRNSNGDTAFVLGGASFDGVRGELIRFYDAASKTTWIQGDVDGDGDADLSIAAKGDRASFSHFIL